MFVGGPLGPNESAPCRDQNHPTCARFANFVIRMQRRYLIDQEGLKPGRPFVGRRLQDVVDSESV
jgi:hypothetical protein